MEEQISQMRDPSRKLCTIAHTLIKDSVLAEIRRVAGPWPQLEKLLAKRTEEALEKKYEKALAGVEVELEKEKTWLWTNNKYFYNTINNMRQARIEAAARALQNKQGMIAAASLKSMFGHGRSNEEEELVEIADRVIAYYKVLPHPHPDNTLCCATQTSATTPTTAPIQYRRPPARA
jgi:hypothetical protein